VFKRNTSSLFGVIGMFALLGACLLCVLAPVMAGGGVSIARLPQPAPGDLSALAPGTRIVLPVRMPERGTDDEPRFALFASDTRSVTVTLKSANNNRYESVDNGSWRRRSITPKTIEARLSDDTALMLDLPNDTGLLNAQEDLREAARLPGVSEDIRLQGFAPAQPVAARGEWTGRTLIVEELYGGTPADYVQYVMIEQPLGLLRAGLCCLTAGLLCLGIAAAGRLRRRLGR
jgi:hypothetical protein